VTSSTYIHTAAGCTVWEQWLAWGRWETMKSLVGFLPAGLGSLLCFGVFAGPMARFVRQGHGR
jgi:hypothetical protein